MSGTSKYLLSQTINPCFVPLERLSEDLVQKYLEKEGASVSNEPKGNKQGGRKRRRGRPSKKGSKAQGSKLPQKKKSGLGGNQAPKKKSSEIQAEPGGSGVLAPPNSKNEGVENAQKEGGNEKEQGLPRDVDCDKQSGEFSGEKNETIANKTSSGRCNRVNKNDEKSEEKKGQLNNEEEEEVMEIDEEDVPAAKELANETPEQGVEEESDLPEKSEDDTETVVFGGEASYDSGNEGAADTEDEPTETNVSKTRKKKRLNRKKRDLLKLRRERSMVKRQFISASELVEQPLEIIPDVKKLFNDICGLVKTLFQLNAIISHLELAIPDDPELAENFRKTIEVEKKTFDFELVKNQNVIIRGCEKLVPYYGTSIKLGEEMTKKTRLTRQNISDVLEWCSLRFVKDDEDVVVIEGPGSTQAASQKNPGTSSSAKERQKITINYEAEVIPMEESSDSEELDLPLESSDSEDEAVVQLKAILRKRMQQNAASAKSAAASRLNKPSEGPSVEPAQQPGPSQIAPKDLTAEKNSQKAQLPSEPPKKTGEQPGNPAQDKGPGSPKRKACPKRKAPENKQNEKAAPKKPRGRPRGATTKTSSQPGVSGVRKLAAKPRTQRRKGGPPPGNAVSNVPINNAATLANNGPVPGRVIFQLPQPEPLEPVRSKLLIQSATKINNTNYFQVNLVASQALTSGSATAFYTQPSTQIYYQPAYILPQPIMAYTSPQVNAGSSASGSFNFMQQTINYTAPNQIYAGRSCTIKSSVTNSIEYLQLGVPIDDGSRPGTSQVREPLSIAAGMMPRADESNQLPAPPRERFNDTLDPTIPQKLMLRNNRLEAGPIIEVNNSGDGDTVGTAQLPSSVSEPGCSGGDDEPQNLQVPPQVPREAKCAETECTGPGTRVCRNCMNIYYCSSDCQLQHWLKKHKYECHQMRELRGLEGSSQNKNSSSA